MDTYILLYLKQITNKDLLYSTWNSGWCYMAAWMGGKFGGEWIHVYVQLSPFSCPPGTIPTLLIVNQLQSNIKLKVFFFFKNHLWGSLNHRKLGHMAVISVSLSLGCSLRILLSKGPQMMLMFLAQGLHFQNNMDQNSSVIITSKW